MDYEKKYNDALERAKKLMVGFEGYDANVEIIKNIFPELRESEDERVRKVLLNLVSNDKVAGYTKFYEERGITCDDAIAYLEKQKEQKPSWNEEDEDRIRQIERIAQQAGCTQKLQEEIHDWLKSIRPQPKQDRQGKR